IFSRGKPLKKVPQDRLVDELFAEIDRYYAAGRRIESDDAQAAEGAEWLARIEAENAGDLTPERLAALEKAKQAEQAEAMDAARQPGGASSEPVRLDEAASPTAGRRFTRA